MKPLYQTLEIAKEFLCAGVNTTCEKSWYICHALMIAQGSGKISKAEADKAKEFIHKKLGVAYGYLIDLLKEKGVIPMGMRVTDKEYAPYRDAWLNAEIEKLKKQIRKPKVESHILASEGSTLKVGDEVEIIACPEAMAWCGWVETMDKSIGIKGSIISIRGTEAKISEGLGFWYPLSSLKKIS